MATCFGPLPVGRSSDTFVIIKVICVQAGSRLREAISIMPYNRTLLKF
jgi:hypothetical protein